MFLRPNCHDISCKIKYKYRDKSAKMKKKCKDTRECQM